MLDTDQVFVSAGIFADRVADGLETAERMSWTEVQMNHLVPVHWTTDQRTTEASYIESRRECASRRTGGAIGGLDGVFARDKYR